MADEPKNKKRVTKRKGAKRKPAPKNRNIAKIPVCGEVLKEVWIHISKEKLTGYITFLTKSDKQIIRILRYSCLPEGIWTIKTDIKNYYTGQPVAVKNVGDDTFKRVKSLWAAGTTLFDWRIETKDKFPFDEMVDCLLASVKGKEFHVLVTNVVYTPGSKSDFPQALAKPLSDDFLDSLTIPVIALIFIQMFEHFGNVYFENWVWAAVSNGLDKKEQEKIFAIQPKNKEFPPKLIARIVTQGYAEYKAIGKGSKEWQVDADFLHAMVETILNQRKKKNSHALNNQLEIGMGYLLLTNNQVIEDLGIKLRGNGDMLLYDKLGYPVKAQIGYMDPFYRVLDLELIKVRDSAELRFMQVLAHEFSFPVFEIYQMAEAMCIFIKYISQEVYVQRQLLGEETWKKIKAMAPFVVLFFLIHSIGGFLIKRGNPIGFAIIAVAKAAGWIMGLDFTIAALKNMEWAGFHYSRMQEIHSKTPGETPKKKLSTVSEYHLKMGTYFLVLAISDVLALGVYIIGGKLVRKGVESKDAKAQRLAEIQIKKEAKAERKRLRKEQRELIRQIEIEYQRELKRVFSEKAKFTQSRKGATLEIEVEATEAPSGKGKIINIKITKAKALKGKTKLKIPADPIGTGVGNLPKTGRGTIKAEAEGRPAGKTKTGVELKVIDGGKSKTGSEKLKLSGPRPIVSESGIKAKGFDSVPAELDGKHLGEPAKSATPEPGKRISVAAYQLSGEIKNPAKAESASGIPKEWIEIAKEMSLGETGKPETGQVIILRFAQPRGIQHYGEGKFKGKDLIDLHTDPITGKVTAKDLKQRQIAWDKGYYILKPSGIEGQGIAVDAAGKALAVDGKVLRFDMSKKGQFGEATYKEGQVITKDGKCIYPDIDVFGVFPDQSPGRNLVPVPESPHASVSDPIFNRFMSTFNSRVKAEFKKRTGKEIDDPVVHGPHEQFITRQQFGVERFRGDVLVVKDGKAFLVSQGQLAAFYKAIGRPIQELPLAIIKQLGPYGDKTTK